MSSIYKVLTRQGLHRSQHEMSQWLQSSSSGTGVRQLVTPTPGTTGQPSERHRGRDRATSIFSFTHSRVSPALLLFFGPRPRAADSDARAEIRDTGSIPGLAADLPWEPGQDSLLLLPQFFLAERFNPWHFSTFHRSTLKHFAERSYASLFPFYRQGS